MITSVPVFGSPSPEKTPRMLLLCRRRTGHRRCASLLLLAAVLLCVAPLCASLPAGRKCPDHIDCAREGRHFCRPGSSQCGPCLPALEENKDGRCMANKRHPQHGTFFPDPDEEIDFIHSVIEKNEVFEKKMAKKQPQQPDVKKSKTDASKNGKQKSPEGQSDRSQQVPVTDPPPETTTTPQPRATGLRGRVGPIGVPTSGNDSVIIVMVSLCVVMGTVAVVLATVCIVKTQKESRLAQKVDYPAFRETGVPAVPTNGTTMGDKSLAQSAQMYHYQHQKQQMLSVGNQQPEQKVHDNEVTSDEEEVGGDFMVYECPGLAPTGEMEVKNPLFDDSTIHYQGNQK